MKPKDQRRTIGELLARAKAGETDELRLRFVEKLRNGKKRIVDDASVLADLDRLFDDWDRGLPLSEDDRAFLMHVISNCATLPPRPGNNAKSRQVKEAEAQVLREFRVRWKQRRKAGEDAERVDADEARALGENPLFADKDYKTRVDLLHHKPRRIPD